MKTIFLVNICVCVARALVTFAVSCERDGQEQRLVEGNKSSKVGPKRGSLCAVGSIKMISDSSAGEDERPQLRAVSDSSNVEIILDSGADVSAVPRCYSNTGVQVEQHEAQFIDAQGSPLNVHSTRVAKVTFGMWY